MQNILIIEDDPDLNQTIGYALEKAGYGVFRADSIRKAETIFVREKICLVLLDVNLPDGEGYTFCRWAKAQREVPVIYLTARDLEEDALEGYDSGAEDYVTKPFSMKILLKKLDVVLKRLTPAGSQVFQDDHLRMDLEQARLYVDGRVQRDADRGPDAASVSFKPGAAFDLRGDAGPFMGQWRSVCG